MHWGRPSTAPPLLMTASQNNIVPERDGGSMSEESQPRGTYVCQVEHPAVRPNLPTAVVEAGGMDACLCAWRERILGGKRALCCGRGVSSFPMLRKKYKKRSKRYKRSKIPILHLVCRGRRRMKDAREKSNTAPQQQEQHSSSSVQHTTSGESG